MAFPSPISNSLLKQTWLAVLLCMLPIGLYFGIFAELALNVNYVAFDDILILGVIPGFEEASWLERWQRLTDPFPEHRLIFSRSLVLASYYLFGKVNLVSLMVIGNLCWLGCAGVFYAVFRRLKLSLWYFVPIVWIWFTIHSFENMFWGVSSLCNFGVLFFAMLAFYFATYAPDRLFVALLFALLATYSYGNGIVVFAIIAILLWITGRRKDFFITVGVTIVVGVIYFAGFPQKTDSLDISDMQQVKEGIAGFFGFIGSIAALDAYTTDPIPLALTVGAGILIIITFLLLLRRKLLPLFHALVGRPLPLSPMGQFALAIFIFIAITSFAVVYKRIPLGGFESLFKGRYRMYTALALVALHFGALAWLLPARRRMWAIVAIPFTIILNLAILYVNFAVAVNSRRAAIIQEFNTRYNADWLGLSMFEMDQAHFEKIRSYYQSADPLAEGWNPRAATTTLPCVGNYPLDTLFQYKEAIHAYAMKNFVEAEKNYTDGPYMLLKSATHVYASAPDQFAVPLQTFLRRLRYFARGFEGSFHQDTVEPGVYKIYVLIRQDGKNKLYCTGREWVEE
ncbi:hypothetical protein [Salmonirosea aquatica]|uniref:Glycosyltransferase RgtA/B/C/D-like domain-containing protein n=1 Tax=Salmonirosea aquatica TaxID=2654236 RepID=A0A7C9BRH9_9BACT|nr:hypothetical protein [Cytophagaceae bacterium SJW1-29]